ncbi:nickel/cobalt transporter [Moellerella wisconsensis]|uniref:nickel/cobalt transporter n=1 Tax=Moellerella wisconsensis TaxID=158849 RepID=UPI0025B0A9B6|nr:nickel/cobalt transporter [Moellerella wisconsensis]WJW82465.1 nickel/cobalt transporter [Moellerella wisconsensis]
MPIISADKFKWIKKSSWLLAIITLSLVIGYMVYTHWIVWLQQVVIWQRSLNYHLSELLQKVDTEPQQAGIILIAASFIYGLLHAMGPGHGKVIITSYIATHPTKLKRSVLLTLLASLLQASMAIIIVSAVLYLFQLSTRYVHQSSLILEKLSYGTMVVLGAIFCASAGKSLFKTLISPPKSSLKINAIKSISSHQHSKNCACSHQHTVSENILNSDWKTQLMVVISMGIRPCSGAILLLIFAYVINAYEWGIVATLVMSLGTALTISFIAIFVFYLRKTAIRLSQWQGAKFSPIWLLIVKILAGIFLICIGVLMFQSLTLVDAKSSNLLLR